MSPVEKLHLQSKQNFEFTCGEANTGCKQVRAVGRALSFCCIKQLSDVIKLTMSKCEEGGFLCMLDSGTLLGALKFNSVLPWELDADIIIHTNNFTAFGEKYQSYFEGLGYSWELTTGPPAFKFHTPDWKVEVFHEDFMDIETFIAQGISSTVMDFDGTYLKTPGNPGLTSRNRYGKEIYQHIQHQVDLSDADHIPRTFYSTSSKKFTKCNKPGHHSCLDMFVPDGNLLFRFN